MVLLKCSSNQSWYRFGEPTQAKESFSFNISRLKQARGNRILMICNEYSQKGWEAEAEQKKMNQETLENNNPEAKVQKRQGGVHITSEWWQRRILGYCSRPVCLVSWSTARLPIFTAERSRKRVQKDCQIQGTFAAR